MKTQSKTKEQLLKEITLLKAKIEELEKSEIVHKQVEKTLQFERDNLNNIFDAMEDGIYIVDQKHNIQYINSSLLQDFGKYDGRKCYEYFHNRNKICSWCKNVEIFKGKTVHWEFHVSKNQKTYDLIDTPLINADGSISKLEIIRDITKRKQIEEKLKVSEERFRSIFSNISNIAVQGYDKNRKVTFWNKASEHLYGYSQKEAINKKLEDLIIPSEMKSAVISMTDNWYENNIKIPNSELVLMKKDGTPIQVFSSHVMIEKSNDEKEMFCIDIDITDRKKAEEEIITSRERLKMLNKIIRHDLTNDFLVIRSAINIFKRTSDTSMLNEIEKKVKKSLTSIANYRRHESLIDSNQGFNEIEITELFKDYIAEFPKIKFSFKGKCKVLADNALDSVFRNLVTNSIKHGNSTKIDIIISYDNEMCKIRFIDNGTGIPDKIKNKIFDEGFVYGKKGHTGIGLHIVKNAIERYGGSISVEDSETNGAVFLISLKKTFEK